jgi:hypothetical protein
MEEERELHRVGAESVIEEQSTDLVGFPIQDKNFDFYFNSNWEATLKLFSKTIFGLFKWSNFSDLTVFLLHKNTNTQ